MGRGDIAIELSERDGKGKGSSSKRKDRAKGSIQCISRAHLFVFLFIGKGSLLDV